jgi:predicted TPR repeat methyltransferase
VELTIEQALLKAVESHKAGMLQDAERLYRAILQAQPKQPDANHNLGVLAISVNMPDVALPLFKTALEANPSQAQFWLSYIDALIKEKQFDNARHLLSEGKKAGLEGGKFEALEAQLAKNLRLQSSESLSKNKLLTLTPQHKKVTKKKKDKKKNSLSNQTNFNQARNPSQLDLNTLLEHYQTGRYDLAENLAEDLIQKYPDHQFGWKVLGAVFKQTGRLEDSLIANQRSVGLAPNDAKAHYNLGNTLKELRRHEEAETSYKKAISISPDYFEAYSNLGTTLKELGRVQEAERIYKQAIAIKSDYAQAHNNLGNIRKELGRLVDAETSFNKAISIEPSYAQAHNNLGTTLQELGRSKEAEQSYKKAIAIKPDYAQAHINLGNLLKELGRLEDAETSFKKAIAIKPEYAEAHNNLGITLQELGRLGDAETSYKKAIEIKPDLEQAHNNLGNLLKELGRLEDAETSFNKAIKIKPDYAQAHNNLGNTLQELGRLGDAETSYKKAIAIKPEYAGMLGHVIASISGLNPVRANDAYISDLFDGYAKKFESSLVGKLNYKTPTIIANCLLPLISSENSNFDILDLGCGTGLAGEALIGLAKTLVGIDLSKEMLKFAKAKNIYDRLIQDEINHALSQEQSSSFDLVVSSDVFVYVGDLKAIFDQVFDVLKIGGFFAYSTEALLPSSNDKEEVLLDYKLNQNGRYSHSSKYLLGLIDPKRFILRTLEVTQIRLEKGQPVMGYVVIMQKQT